MEVQTNGATRANLDQDFVDFVKIGSQLWRSKWLVLLGSLLGGTLLAIYAFLASPVYRAEVKFTLNTNASASAGLQSQLVSQFGGLASLAGISVSGDADRSSAVELLTSYGFLEQFIVAHRLKDLLAPNSSNFLGRTEIRTIQDAVIKLQRNVVSVVDNKKTGIVALTVDLGDRNMAAEWANSLVAQANMQLKDRAITDSRNHRKFLENQIQSTSVVEVQRSIYRLIEAELKSEMIAQTQNDFVFRVIDAAYVPDKNRFIRPKREMMIIVGIVIGFLVSSVGLLLRSRFRNANVA